MRLYLRSLMFPVSLFICFLGQNHLMVLAQPNPSSEQNIVVADFEGADYAGWVATGTAFGAGPAQGTLPNQMPVDGFLGHGLVNSYHGGDASTGTLTSPPFNVQRRYIRFLIGGGKSLGTLGMNLKIDGKVARTATGPNDRPGGSEHLDVQEWDVAEFLGKSAQLEIVDQATGGWGHINIDHIVQTDSKLPGCLTNATRELLLNGRYLNLPVKNKAPKRRVSLAVDSAVVREFEIELADNEPDFWVFLDLGPFRGKKGVLTVDRLPETSRALQAIEAGDAIKGAENLYREPLRPQFHFSSRRGWNNDPNGLVFFKGEYHLYYQHNPYGWEWGNMHWGHAVSPDLVHWKELPIALYPRRFGDWAFSGSAVVDWKNSAGFQRGREEVLVGAFTSTGRGECIVYSEDLGRTWLEYSGNPVVKHEGRDPRLLWHAGTGRWVMALYDEKDNARDIVFYTSSDLKNWRFESRIGGFFECPDLFELPVDGNRKETRWVLTAASSEYMVGQFDGRVFTPETPKLPGHVGAGFYAAQTYSDIPAKDGRTIQVGWGQVGMPGMPFNQMMWFPTELNLRRSPDGLRLAWTPVREIKKLREKTVTKKNFTLSPSGIAATESRTSGPRPKPSGNPLAGMDAELAEVRMDFDLPGAGQVKLSLRGVGVVYDGVSREISCNGKKGRVRSGASRLEVIVLVDRSSVEVFADGGLVYLPIPVRPDAANREFDLACFGGEVRVRTLEAHGLRSIWR
jgi:fructan beta-fructosidase